MVISVRDLVCPDTNGLNLVLPIVTESPWRMTLVNPHFCDGSYTSQSVDPHFTQWTHTSVWVLYKSVSGLSWVLYICHSLKMHEFFRKT